MGLKAVNFLFVNVMLYKQKCLESAIISDLYNLWDLDPRPEPADLDLRPELTIFLQNYTPNWSNFLSIPYRFP